MDAEVNYVFKGEGHQQPGRTASNLFVNFVLVPPHHKSHDFEVTSRYSRQQKNLFYRKKITLQDALNCRPMKIPMLDGRFVLLAVDQVITPKTIKKIEGEGMVTYDKKDYSDALRTQRGDLYVTFEIEFPKNLTTD